MSNIYQIKGKLDLSQTKVLNALQDRDLMHKTLMSLYPDDLGESPRESIDLLYYANPDTGCILIQSTEYPSVCTSAMASEDFFDSYTINNPEIFSAVKDGKLVDFHLTFAATKRETESGKRIALDDDTEVLAKATDVLMAAGLSVTLSGIKTKHLIQSKRRRIVYPNVEIKGSGHVINELRLKEALIKGVGANRVWGSGVLLVNPTSIKRPKQLFEPLLEH